MISKEQIKAFILAQPDTRPVNMYEGSREHRSDLVGCVLLHYAEANSLPFEHSIVFSFIGEEPVEGSASVMLCALCPGGNPTAATETYGDLKQRLPQLEITKRYD